MEYWRCKMIWKAKANFRMGQQFTSEELEQRYAETHHLKAEELEEKPVGQELTLRMGVPSSFIKFVKVEVNDDGFA